MNKTMKKELLKIGLNYFPGIFSFVLAICFALSQLSFFVFSLYTMIAISFGITLLLEVIAYAIARTVIERQVNTNDDKCV